MHMKSGLYRTVVAAFALAVAASANAAEYASAKPLLVKAIDAGVADGILVGPIADKITRATGSSSPVLAEVTTIKSLKREGCKRLNLRISQANVPTKDGHQIVYAMDYGINLCRDGSPAVDE